MSHLEDRDGFNPDGVAARAGCRHDTPDAIVTAVQHRGDDLEFRMSRSLPEHWKLPSRNHQMPSKLGSSC